MKQSLEIVSIRYIHDPTAAKKWFSLWVDLVKEELIAQAHRNFQEDNEEDDCEEDGCIFAEFNGSPGEFDKNTE